MKNLVNRGVQIADRYFMAGVLVAIGMVMLSACGKGNDAAPTNTTAAQTCPAGQTWSGTYCAVNGYNANGYGNTNGYNNPYGNGTTNGVVTGTSAANCPGGGFYQDACYTGQVNSPSCPAANNVNINQYNYPGGPICVSSQGTCSAGTIFNGSRCVNPSMGGNMNGMNTGYNAGFNAGFSFYCHQ